MLSEAQLHAVATRSFLSGEGVERGGGGGGGGGDEGTHTPNIAFRHLPPDSARFSSATEGVLFISAEVSRFGLALSRYIGW